ncbi:hypothetical protein COW36_12540 [bacterium (Candidatus Blackallbacteria) CG17_big_fil_post_rev_8_21_14_2_50_48_46]|uniref:Ig-like domain-containing protein n=1 Tax=bacterium (Candidatus Blackallbacteria) CG17_big_fil_post_rev_8_21_14_2_50_48_46 TaxID=2014261 RepID=A0A2M7G401_9BACT|nr:MAG: hypothetical protein COW64_02720 [bacterium (Candidatus Blackallbacteria) CG18_big_fil_WC_8_21_14_2_50_49_26]PIW16589.1 MAG: hypothetical protein COW36_12540 [bacterium (Candidatus Blackallbacteria) CG17_big_fil_post_rev_8_21_14_2_50_48_46]PIW46097.1 MAG: hypothetical protein COW20_17805 [bacterium (Candidatus Blackallbacteria) CG13_big_fil_rev_8_21_14_2_50_49_14]
MKVTIFPFLSMVGFTALLACNTASQPLSGQRPSGIQDEATVGNSPPIIQALTSSALSINKGGTATLRVVAYDGEGDPLTYRWSSTRGTLLQTEGAEVSWNSLKNGQPEKGMGILMVEVSDGKYTTPGALNILIKEDGSSRLELDTQAANLLCRKDPTEGKTRDALATDDLLPPLKLGSKVLKTQTMVLDGKPEDWQNILPVVQDSPRDTGNSESGMDLRALYLARDSRHLYYRLDTWGKPEPAKAQDYRLSMGWTGNIHKDGLPETTGLEVGQIVEGKIPIVNLSSLDKLYVSGVIRSGTQLADRTRLVKLLDQPEPVPSATPLPSGNNTSRVARQIFSNFEIALNYFSDPSCQPSFTTTQAYLLAGVVNYHSTSSTGPVEISLKSSSGQVYGPWPATGSSTTASSGARLWTASPANLVLPAGSYTVQDSATTTWLSATSASCGMSVVQGVAQ